MGQDEGVGEVFPDGMDAGRAACPTDAAKVELGPPNDDARDSLRGNDNVGNDGGRAAHPTDTAKVELGPPDERGPKRSGLTVIALNDIIWM